MKRLIFLRFIIFCFITFFCFSLAYSIPKEIEDALKLNRINHFEEAIDIIQKALDEEKIKPDITSAYTMGRILYRKGEFYRETARLNILTSVSYLLQVKEREKDPTDEIKLFLGIGYFFNNQEVEAAGILNQVVKNKKLKGELYDLSLSYLGASYYRSGEKEKAKGLWEKIDNDYILAYSTLGYLYAYLGINPSEGENITRNALKRIGRSNKEYVNSLKLNHAFTLLTLGRFDEAYSEVEHINLNVPIFVYKPTRKKEIRFYDLSSIDSYSKIIFGESIKNLEPVATASSGELASFASYYVAQMYLYLGNFEKSLKLVRRAKKLSVSSSLTMIRSSALEAVNNILIGKAKRGLKLLKVEVDNIYGKPSYLLELMKVVIGSRVDYSNVKAVVQEVESNIYQIEWNRTRRDNALLGELSFYTGRYVRALYYLERARDKGNKNKIETNDPVFLLELSYAYYNKEYFPESLEILFSLGKAFSGIRPIQNAIQSVYSYRQKGSGEAIID